MAIKSVTTENIAQFVADRQAVGAEIKTPEQVAALDGKGETRIVATGTETVSTAPDPGEQKPAPKAEGEAPEDDDDKAPKWYRDRLKQLSREKKELEEIAQEEYETRMTLQGKLKAAESKPEPVQDNRPDRTKYKAEEADKYEDDLLSWNRRQTKREMAQEQHQRTIAQNLAASSEAARKEFEDFDEVIQRASRADKQVPAHITAAISESSYGAHLAYYLAKHPKVESEILSLPPATALLKLGEIQTQLKGKETKEVSPTPAPQIPPVTRAPPPLPAVGSGAGNVATDLSSVPFAQYRRIRQEQRAKQRRGAH